MTPPPDGAFGLVQAALQLLNNLAAIVLKSREEDSPLAYSEAIKKMGADIHGRALELQGELRDMDEKLAVLQDRGYAVDKSLADAQRSGWFYKVLPFAPYRMLRNFGARVLSITNQCEAIFSDVLSVANCREAEDEIAAAITKARDAVRVLRDTASTTSPMRKAVRALLEEANILVEITNQL